MSGSCKRKSQPQSPEGDGREFLMLGDHVDVGRHHGDEQSDKSPGGSAACRKQMQVFRREQSCAAEYFEEAAYVDELQVRRQIGRARSFIVERRFTMKCAAPAAMKRTEKIARPTIMCLWKLKTDSRDSSAIRHSTANVHMKLLCCGRERISMVTNVIMRRNDVGLLSRKQFLDWQRKRLFQCVFIRLLCGILALFCGH